MAKLFLIVGNSGSGKDSLIKEVQDNFPEHLKEIKVPKRVITRPPSPETEKYESIDEKTFLKLKKEGAFALDWHIYNLYYGVRENINDWLRKGYSVLINVSRKIISDARKKYPDMKVIFVKVPFEVTEKRIRERGRENEEYMRMRLERARKNQNFPDADFVIDNSGSLQQAGKKLLEYVILEIEKKD